MFKSDLTDQQINFALYYLENFNPKTAAIKAGYSPRSAHVAASRLLNDDKIKDVITKIKATQAEELYLKSRDIVNRHMKIAFSDMADYVEFGKKTVQRILIDKNGQTDCFDEDVEYLNFKNSSEVDTTLITKVEKTKFGIKLELEDRKNSLNWLSEYFDLSKDKKETFPVINIVRDKS